MNIYDSTKTATRLAKAGEYNEAIDLLKLTITEMLKVGGYGNNGYTKIIPYFQKAGRYSEAIEFCTTQLFDAVTMDHRITFNHRCIEIQEAFIELSKSQIYDKLRLNAKREGQNSDREVFANLTEQHFLNYQNLLAVGLKKQQESRSN